MTRFARLTANATNEFANFRKWIAFRGILRSPPKQISNPRISSHSVLLPGISLRWATTSKRNQTSVTTLGRARVSSPLVCSKKKPRSFPFKAGRPLVPLLSKARQFFFQLEITFFHVRTLANFLRFCRVFFTPTRAVEITLPPVRKSNPRT